MEAADWHADLDALAAGLTRCHRNPFHTISAERFATEVSMLHERIPTLSDSGVVVDLDGIAALIGDGHTSVETDRHYRRFPLELFWYGDQLRVVRARVEDPRVSGARLVAVGGVDVTEIHRRLQRLIPQSENEWYVRARSAARFTCADVLARLDCLPDPTEGTFTITGEDGTTVTTRIDSLPPGAEPDWPAPAADAPPRRRDPDRPLAYTPLPAADAAYVNFRRYDDLDSTGPALFAQLRATAPARLILDLRDNGGGDYTRAREHLVYPLAWLSATHRLGLYVLIGRHTFSAAMVTATDFRRETEAVLVGEPTGARPVGYQERGTFDLPRSGLRAQCATRHYRFSDTDRPAVFPDHQIDPDWDVERSGGDAALEWCLAQPH